MTQLRLRSSSFHEHGSGSSSGAVGFHECGSGSRSGFCSFSHISIFIYLGVSQVERKMNYIKYTKLREYTKLFEQFNLVIFYKQRSYHEEISEKEQSQVQTIQRAITSGNATKDNGNQCRIYL